MAKKKRAGNDPRRVRGAPGHARAERERVHAEHKERELRAVLQRLHALRHGTTASKCSGAPGATSDDQRELDECFRQVRQLATSARGLVSDALRRELWPFLLGGPVPHLDAKLLASDHQDKQEAHRDAAQLEKDIERSLWHYDVLQSIKESDRRTKRKALSRVITTVLRTDDQLYYFQGYHDVCSVFLLVLADPERTVHAVKRVSDTYQREPMRAGFESVMATTRLLFPLLDAADEELFEHLRESAVEPFFALPWLITWFAHQLTRFQDVSRLYDVFLVSHPLFSLYVSAAVVLEERARVLRCEPDFGTMHGLLAKLPRTMDVEKVIARAVVLFHQLPPAHLIQQNQVDSAVASTTYFQFPFAFQPWPSISTPLLTDVPSLPPRRTRGDGKTQWQLGSWQVSVVATAATIGIAAIVSAYVLRDRIGLLAS